MCYIQRRYSGLCMVAVINALAIVAGATFAFAAPARANVLPEEAQARVSEPWGAQTLRSNPGSRRVSENAILVQPGIMVVGPSNGEASTRGPGQCPRGWLCAWVDIDFRGPMMAIQRGVHVWYSHWWFHTVTGEIVYSRGYPPGSDPNWDDFGLDITSVFNNLVDLTWAPFYDPFRQENYYAHQGAPASYVGAAWNDHFSQACAC